MSEQLIDVVFSQLQFEIPSDNKGIMVVGNYGTGKSHLQAVISAIAEHGDFADLITHPKVAEKAATIAGRFIVIRAEINSSMPLRQFVMETLQDQLAAHGIDFDVPPEEAIKNHKDVFGDMMAAFTTRFPEQGLLFVLDELLDYLRANNEQELMRIAREDVAHVVVERLLKKDAQQQALVREHLTPFAPLYGAMNERMDEFVRLFPVHPVYLDTFERVYVA